MAIDGWQCKAVREELWFGIEISSMRQLADNLFAR